MSATKNYLLGDTYYTAIRIPISKPERLARRGWASWRAPRPTVRTRMSRTSRTRRWLPFAAYAKRTSPSTDAMEHIERYDLEQTRKSEVAGSRARRMENYRRTLIDRPWAKCDCAVCRDVGVEVVIFRRNDRNRRRGFHNVRDFYRNLRDRERRARSDVPQPTLGF